MEFGLNFPARIDAWKDLTVAEDLGFTSAWFYDSQMLNSDVYVTMAIAAGAHARRIRIGTGIAGTSNHIGAPLPRIQSPPSTRWRPGARCSESAPGSPDAT